jgi:hypothetical protein
MAGKRPWALWACGEFCGVLPDGRVKPSDLTKGRHWRVEAGQRLALHAPRNGWLSFRAVVEGGGAFALTCETAGGEIVCDLYREFYHKMADKAEWYGDALVPVEPGAALQLPDPDNQAPDQSAQSFWVDLFVPAEAKVGTHSGRLVLKAGGETLAIDLALDVLDLTYPDADCVQMDHNSYGSSFLVRQYGQSVPATEGPAQDAALVKLIHAYHALVFEHHGLFHQLGFGHSGATTPLFAPRLAGDGRKRHVADWDLYDRHYGPLFDGSAFRAGVRKPQPIYSVYTPLTPNWPADYLGWGRPGYQVEWNNVLRDFDAHFRAKGWTNTRLELLFNHKKRYRYFEWDGDEPRFPRDDGYFRAYRALLDGAVGGSPVRWKFRVDSSWLMKEHWTALAGVVDFWVCGGFVDIYEQEVHAGPMARGDIVWWYGGAPGIAAASSDIVQWAYKTWIRDFDGYCNWLTTSPGDDPWFASNGAALAMMYPGERFGIAGPIPSARLKVQRNAVQDLNLLELVAQARGENVVKADLIPTIPLPLWRKPSPGQREKPPHEWTGVDFQTPSEPDQQKPEPLDPLWWQPVRHYARKHALEVSRG